MVVPFWLKSGALCHDSRMVVQLSGLSSGKNVTHDLYA
jgi:hypothetical protein